MAKLVALSFGRLERILPVPLRLEGLWGLRAYHGLRISCLTNKRQQKAKLSYEAYSIPSLIAKHCLPVVAMCTLSHLKCWNCQEEFTSYSSVCSSCKSLQPSNQKLNYFDVMKVEKRFGMETKQLSKTFRLLQAQFHPDRFTLKSEREQQYAADHSSQINKAYRCLLHPVERALYLLELAGQPLHEGQIDMDPEFLMEIMEVNEELAEADDKETVQEIGQKNQRILDNLLQEADTAFSNEDINTARQVVAKIKYYNNIYEKVRDYERSHGIID